MEEHRYHRPESYRRDIRRRNRRRKKLFFGSVFLLLLLAVGGFFLRDWLRDEKSPVVKEEPGQVDPPVVEAPEEEEVPELPEVKPFVRSQRAVKISKVAALPGEMDFTALKPGTNHSYEASAYAYDTADVKAWMRGEKPFEEEQKIAFLTFDDGPVYNTTLVMEVLKRREVPGTFFILGRHLDLYQDKSILHRYIEEGHSIAVHSYSHDYGYMYPGRSARADRVVEEYDKTLQLMKETLGEDFESKVFRFPGGAMSWNNIPAAQEALLDLGVVDIDWNSLSGDSEPAHRRPATTQAMGRFAMETYRQYGAQGVAVILMHDAQGVTAEYLDIVIDEFQAAGFKFGVLK